MKRIVLTLLMLATVAAISNANTPSKLKVKMKSASAFDVRYHSSQKSNVKVTIADSQQKNLASRTVKNTSGFNLPVTLENLKPGKYFVIINDGSQELIAEISTLNTEPVYSHVAKLDANRYLVSITSPRSAQRLEINVYDGLSKLVLSTTQVIDGEKAMVFRTTNVAGTPSFEVVDPSGKTPVIQNK